MAGSGNHKPTQKTTHLLPGVELATKHHQGSLDGLCGLYAAINAIDVMLVANGPEPAVEADNLMQAALAYLNTHNILEEAIGEGMPVVVQYRLLKAVLKFTRRTYGHSLTASKIFANKKHVIPSAL